MVIKLAFEVIFRNLHTLLTEGGFIIIATI